MTPVEKFLMIAAIAALFTLLISVRARVHKRRANFRGDIERAAMLSGADLDKMGALWSVPRETWFGKDAFDIIHPETDESYRARILRVVRKHVELS